MSLAELSATELARRLRAGEITATAVAEAHLARIGEADGEIRAFVHLDPARTLDEAGERDKRRAAGLPLGPLHGVPVGLKDIISVRGWPLENGTRLDAGKRGMRDAEVVARLRGAGAVVLGKTVTTELAYFAPGPTRNPRDTAHSPGGSSSGSAAAVAAGMAPLTVGTQTKGSVIRPAAFCGVVGYKPTYGAIPRTGVLADSPFLDHLGVFARTVEDIAFAGALMGPDGVDPACIASPGPLGEVALSDPPMAPALAYSATPHGDAAEDWLGDAFAELRAGLGGVDEIDLPGPFGGGLAALETVMAAEMAKTLGIYVDRGGDQVSDALRALVAAGREILAVDYMAAMDWRPVLRAGLDEIFNRYDALICPAAPGEAPEGIGTTGDPVFCALWSFIGAPAITLPLLTGPKGLPVGVQIVGRPGDDARLLRTARWVARRLSPEGA